MIFVMICYDYFYYENKFLIGHNALLLDLIDMSIVYYLFSSRMKLFAYFCLIHSFVQAKPFQKNQFFQHRDDVSDMEESKILENIRGISY